MSIAQQIADWHDEWVRTAKFSVDPSYDATDSQYPELVEDVTPTPESDAQYWAGVRRILAQGD